MERRRAEKAYLISISLEGSCFAVPSPCSMPCLCCVRCATSIASKRNWVEQRTWKGEKLLAFVLLAHV